MKALISHGPGGPETLAFEDIPQPLPQAGEVLLKVLSVGMNFPDALYIRDLYQVKMPRPFAPGSEVCGIVEALGTGTEGLAVGDRVIARCGTGGLAEKVATLATRCVKIAPDAPAHEAAALLLTYTTSYHALVDCGHVQAGETLLVLGAAGGVGSAALDLGRALGARVLAAASSQEKLDFALRHGAQDGIVYPGDAASLSTRDSQKALADQLKQLVGPHGADLVYDPVGGPYSEAATRTLRPHGRHLVVGFTAGIPRLPLNLVLLKRSLIVGVDLRNFSESDPQANARNVQTIIDLWQAGKIRPAVSTRFAFEQGAQALVALESRQALGKLVVDVSS
jgi:NADPH2:quinone reductase